MERGLYSALSGAMAQSDALDVVSNNIANASTPGFRAQRVSFAEVLGRAEERVAPQVQIDASLPDRSAGTKVATGHPLDLSIEGQGFFALQAPAGVRYTRAGNFQVDSEGTLVSADGLPALDRNGGRITIPADAKNVRVGGEGTIFADGEVAGELMIAGIQPTALISEGRHFTLAPGGVPELEARPKVVSGALEAGNLNVVRSMAELIKISRTYEALGRMIQGYKEIDDRTAREITGGR